MNGKSRKNPTGPRDPLPGHNPAPNPRDPRDNPETEPRNNPTTPHDPEVEP